MQALRNKTAQSHSLSRDLLKVYTYYRLILSFLMLLLSVLAEENQLVGGQNPELFFIVVSIYVTINLANLIFLIRSQFHTRMEQNFVVIVVDILALTLLMHTSGGVSSGLGVLIIISVAAGSIFLAGQISTLLAAIASMAIITESFYHSFTWGGDLKGLFPSGVLGILIFFTALIFQSLSRRISATTLIAEQKAAQAASLEKLNHYIVQRMRTGIMVISPSSKIRVMNESAARLLDIPEAIRLSDEDLSLPEIIQAPLRAWQENQYSKMAPIKPHATAPEFLINFSILDSEDTEEGSIASDILIFLDETSEITQQAQQLKLASLGRFTASIAHEIRNPLGAISHAAQLMNESTDLSEGDIRLTHIIQNHCLRMNQVIENVLQLSRREPSRPQTVLLQDWLEDFIQEYLSSADNNPTISKELPPEPITITIDPSHLAQVLTNLFDNGLRYSKMKTGSATLSVKCEINQESGLTSVDIIDDGDGIKKESIPHVFEPFYTTENTGTGLGLYISRELCESNQARLDYTFNQDGKSCFKISFPHHERSLI